MSKILITGSTKGLGYESALWFAKKKSNLILVGRDENDLKKTLLKLPFKKNHRYICLDLQNPDQIKKIDPKNKMFRGLSAIIHCAGGGLGLKEPMISYENFLKLINLNFLSAVELNNKFIPIMKNKNSKIIHIGSIASYEAVGSLGYNCSKALISAYVRTLGRELIKNKIIVTGIMPGGFIGYKNAMWRLKKKNSNAYAKFIKTRLPARKMFKAKDLMPIIDTICNKQVPMLSGSLIVMDAGEGKAYYN